MAEPYEQTEVDKEKDTKKIAEKIESDLQESISYWQSLKAKFTDYYQDYLSYTEKLRDKYKSNTFLPNPFSDVRTIKGRMKSALLSSYPYIGLIPKGAFSPDKERIVLKKEKAYSSQLDEANLRFYLDQWLLDCCIYGTGLPEIGWKRIYKPRPQFYPTIQGKLPLFEKGDRVFIETLVYNGIELGICNIDDIFLPTYCSNILDTPWIIKRFRATIDDLASEKRLVVVKTGDEMFEFQEQPVYDLSALNRLKEKKKVSQISYKDTGEYQRKKSAFYQSVPNSTSMPLEFVEYITDQKICIKPVGENFLVREDANPIRMKSIGCAQILPLTNEAYGIGIIQPEHKICRTMNEIINVVSDQLWLEDSKMWIVKEDSVSDFEMRSGHGNIVHVRNWEGAVGDAVQAVQTRALATEVFTLLGYFDRTRQVASSAVDVLKGLEFQGSKTATESSYIMGGATGGIEDYLLNLEATLGVWLFNSLEQLNQINYGTTENFYIYDDNGRLVDKFDLTPEEMQEDCSSRFTWAGRERARTDERAQVTQQLQIFGQLPPEAWNNKVILEVIKQLLVLSTARNGEYLVKQLEQQTSGAVASPENGQTPTSPEGGIVQALSDVLRQNAEQIGQSVSPTISR